MTLKDDGGTANSSAHPEEPDAHGQAALLLAESTLHMLLDKKLLTQSDAILVVQTAAAIKVEFAVNAHESDTRMRQSLALLQTIAQSFEVDVNGISLI